MKDFLFLTFRISKYTTRITDMSGSSCFLIEGSRSSVLVDTGTGLGDLKKCVDGLTKKDLQVILTHGHTDHIGGASQFENVYISAEDIELAQRNDDQASKLFSASYTNPAVCRDLSPEDMCPPAVRPFMILESNKVLDLGDVVLEVIPVPGHTKGFMMVLNRTERMLISGDGLNSAVFLIGTDAADIRTYRKSLLSLKRYEDAYDRCLVSHGPLLADKRVLDGTVRVCDELLSGKTDREPYQYAGVSCFFAHRVDAALERIDGGIGNILYTEDRIVL